MLKLKSFLIFYILNGCSQCLASEAPLSFCYEEWQPYAYADKGKNLGLSIRYISEKLNQANIEYKFTELPFPRCKQEVQSGQIDFILHVDDSDDFHLLEQPLNTWQLTFAVAQDSAYSFEDLTSSEGLSVLIARSYNYPEELTMQLKSMSAKLVEVSYYTGELSALKRLFHRLSIGQAQAMVVDKIWAKGVVKQYQLPIKIYEQVIISVPQYIGTAKRNLQRAQRLEKAMCLGKK